MVAPANSLDAETKATEFEDWCVRNGRRPDDWAWECYRAAPLAERSSAAAGVTAGPGLAIGA